MVEENQKSKQQRCMQKVDEKYCASLFITIMSFSSGNLYPENFAKTVAHGYKIHIRMLNSGSSMHHLKKISWLRNGRLLDINSHGRMWTVTGFQN